MRSTRRDFTSPGRFYKAETVFFFFLLLLLVFSFLSPLKGSHATQKTTKGCQKLNAVCGPDEYFRWCFRDSRASVCQSCLRTSLAAPGLLQTLVDVPSQRVSQLILPANGHVSWLCCCHRELRAAINWKVQPCTAQTNELESLEECSTDEYHFCLSKEQLYETAAVAELNDVQIVFWHRGSNKFHPHYR